MEVNEKVVAVLSAFGGILVGVLLGIVICSIIGLWNDPDIEDQIRTLEDLAQHTLDQANAAEEARRIVEERNEALEAEIGRAAKYAIDLEVLIAEERGYRATAEAELDELTKLLSGSDADLAEAIRIVDEALGDDTEETP